MRKLLLAVGLVLGLGPIAGAQQNLPEWQIYALGSYSHSEISPSIPGFRTVNQWGYNLGVEQYANSWVGGVAEFGDFYRRPTVDLTPFGFSGTREEVRTHFLYLVLGPQVRHNFGRFTPFGRATLGFSRRIYKDQANLFTNDENAFAFLTGGGIDVSLRDHISIRPVQADYLLTHFGGDKQSNWRVSAGIVVSFGSK